MEEEMGRYLGRNSNSHNAAAPDPSQRISSCPPHRRWFHLGLEIILVILPILWWLFMMEIGVGSDFVQFSTMVKSLIAGSTFLVIASNLCAMLRLREKMTLQTAIRPGLLAPLTIAIGLLMMMILSALCSLILLLGVFVVWFWN
jgi:hypothetical protein